MRARAGVVVLASGVLGGCGKIKDLQEDIRGLTDSTVLTATILGIAPPEDPSIDVSGTDLESGTTVQLAVLDADSSAANGDMVPVPSVEASVLGNGVGAVPLTFDGALYATEGVPYVAGEVWTLKASLEDGTEASLNLELPPAVNVDVPTEHAVGTEIVLDLTGQGFHAVVVFVTDVATGEQTFAEAPITGDELVDVFTADDFVGIVQIPGSSFPTPSVYAVAVGGVVHHGDDAVDGANTELSGGVAGTLRVFSVSTLPTP
jgi:hypothetical protein